MMRKGKFFLTAEKMDILSKKDRLSHEDISEIILLLKDEEYKKYFFVNCDNPIWFEALGKSDVLLEIKKPRKIRGDNAIQSPAWWPGYYLLKVADKIPEKVVPLLKELQINDNWNALDLCFQIALRLPPDSAKQLLPTIDKWLDLKTSLQIEAEYAVDLLGKFIEAKDYDSALQLFDIISKPSKKTSISSELRIEMYWYREELMKKYLSVLVREKTESILKIIEKRLNETGGVSKSGEDDFSYIWRHSIADSDENAIYGYAEDAFVEILRDTLKEYYGRDEKAAEIIIKKYLNNKYSIYKRIAIYLVDICNISDCYVLILTNKSFMNAPERLPEYSNLLRNKFSLLDVETRREILQLIQAGPEAGKNPEHIKWWITSRLYQIGPMVLQDEKLKEYHELIYKHKELFDEYDKAKKEERSSGWVGPTSPITLEEIKQKPPEELINYLKNEFVSNKGFYQPTPEGLARLLGQAVKENPGPYAAIAERFAEEDLYPAYVSNLLNALHDAWREKKTFEWDSVIKLCDLLLSKNDVKKEDNKRDDFDYGRFEWVRGAIARLLGEAVRTDEHQIDNSFLPSIKRILCHIAEKDLNPEQDHKTYITHNGIETVDYTSAAINCNRGAALESLILYALRYARIRADKEAEKGKGPFPSGHRLEDDIKAFLEKRMKKEISPAVHSMFGRFFQYLYYLDQEWLEEMVNLGFMFPSDLSKNEFWEADWQGYILFNRFYDKLYGFLKNNYKIAIDKVKADSKKKRNRSQLNSNMADHIMIAYVRNLETLDNKGSLVKYFFDSAPVEVRTQAIRFIGSAFEKERSEKDIWIRLKALWEYRTKSVDDDELGAFAQWVKWAPEGIKELYLLIEKSIKCKGKIFQQHGYYDYFLKEVSAYPAESLKLTYELLKASHKYKRLYYGYQDGVKKILDAISQNALEHKEIINSIVNLLGKVGNYSFKEYLVK